MSDLSSSCWASWGMIVNSGTFNWVLITLESKFSNVQLSWFVFLICTHQALPSVLLSAFSKEQEKEKKLEEEHSAPQSAFLGPTLWDKTLPYDGDTFQLEYMDLEEFLSENGIPSSPSHHHHHHDQHQPHPQPRQPQIMSPAPTTPAPSVMDLSNHASTSVNTSVVSPNCLHSSPARAGNSNALRYFHSSHHRFTTRLWTMLLGIRLIFYCCKQTWFYSHFYTL